MLAHSQSASFNLKDVLKKSIAEGTAKGTEAGKGGTANGAVESLNEGQNKEGTPKVMETFGIKIGDTPQQVEKILSGQGYKFDEKTTYSLGPHFPGVLSNLNFSKPAGKNSAYQARSVVQVQFGPQSGKVVNIRRVEKFDDVVVGTEIRKALVEKYGKPSIQNDYDLNWISYRPDPAYKGYDMDNCKARNAFGLIGGRSQNKYKNCRYAVSAALGESPNSGKEFRSIEVIVADFSQMTVEWEASRAMMERKDAEVLEEHKKAPVPKL